MNNVYRPLEKLMCRSELVEPIVCEDVAQCVTNMMNDVLIAKNVI